MHPKLGCETLKEVEYLQPSQKWMVVHHSSGWMAGPHAVVGVCCVGCAAAVRTPQIAYGHWPCGTHGHQYSGYMYDQVSVNLSSGSRQQGRWLMVTHPVIIVSLADEECHLHQGQQQQAQLQTAGRQVCIQDQLHT
jgi:hypothetical protein